MTEEDKENLPVGPSQESEYKKVYTEHHHYEWDISHGEVEEHFEKDEHFEFVEYVKNNKEKATVAFKTFMVNMKTEAGETKEASKLVGKFMKEGKLSKEEEKELKTQIFDLFKMAGIGIPFMIIPGSTLLLPFLLKVAKKRGIDLLPTAFHNEEEEKSIEGNKDEKNSSNE